MSLRTRFLFQEPVQAHLYEMSEHGTLEIDQDLMVLGGHKSENVDSK